MKDMQLHHSGIGVSDWSSINQYCPIADHGQRHVRMGHWLCDRRHAILLVISQTSSQNVNLTSLCRAHPPSGRCFISSDRSSHGNLEEPDSPQPHLPGN